MSQLASLRAASALNTYTHAAAWGLSSASPLNRGFLSTLAILILKPSVCPTQYMKGYRQTSVRICWFAAGIASRAVITSACWITCVGLLRWEARGHMRPHCRRRCPSDGRSHSRRSPVESLPNFTPFLYHYVLSFRSESSNEFFKLKDFTSCKRPWISH